MAGRVPAAAAAAAAATPHPAYNATNRPCPTRSSTVGPKIHSASAQVMHWNQPDGLTREIAAQIHSAARVVSPGPVASSNADRSSPPAGIRLNNSVADAVAATSASVTMGRVREGTASRIGIIGAVYRRRDRAPLDRGRTRAACR